MKVLIVKTSSLGDIVHALPAIDFLHQVSPGIEIDWVVEEQFLPTLEHNPGLSSSSNSHFLGQQHFMQYQYYTCKLHKN